MSNCPVCSAPMVDDFGLVDCGKCGAALFIEFDGTVRQREEGAQVTPPSLPEVDSPTTAFELGGEWSPETAHAQPVDSQADQTMLVGQEEQSSLEEAGEPNVEQSLDSGPASEIPMTPAPEMLAKESSSADSHVLEDLQEFANSDAGAGRDGAYLYDLTITGVDTSDLREAVRQALTDRLFLWDADELIRSVQGGSLNLERMTPVKAAVLVNRLAGLPLQISWVQYASSQA